MSRHLTEPDVDAHSAEDLLVGKGAVRARDVPLGGVPAVTVIADWKEQYIFVDQSTLVFATDV